MSYTPTTEEVREAYVVGVDPEVTARYRAEFDRWLDAHDAEVAERDAATATADRVRAAVEKHKHWNEGCGWDVPTIEVLAALDGAPEPEEKP